MTTNFKIVYIVTYSSTGEPTVRAFTTNPGAPSTDAPDPTNQILYNNYIGKDIDTNDLYVRIGTSSNPVPLWYKVDDKPNAFELDFNNTGTNITNVRDNLGKKYPGGGPPTSPPANFVTFNNIELLFGPSNIGLPIFESPELQIALITHTSCVWVQVPSGSGNYWCI